MSPFVVIGTVVSAMALAPAAANAASLKAVTAPLCSGDLCMRVFVQVNAPNCGYPIVIREWAWKYAFYGHFELQEQYVSKPWNSVETTNNVGVVRAFTVPNSASRTYTGHAWQRSGTDSWNNIGARTLAPAFYC